MSEVATIDYTGVPAAAAGKVRGTCARWTARGYGFIKPEDGSEDVFCHQTAVQDGDSIAKLAFVEYKVVFDEEKGKNRAEEVTGGSVFVREEEVPDAPADYSTVPPAAAGKVRGTCARWTARGYGFIKPEDGSEDVFCHQTAVQDGDSIAKSAFVEYKVVFDEEKGKNRAEEVTGGTTFTRRGGGGGGGGGRSRACHNCGEEGHLARDCPSEKAEQVPEPPADYSSVPAAAAGKSRGVCARWTARGYGFIKPEDGSEDVFCHQTAVQDGDSLAKSAFVEYKVVFDEEKGKNRAEEVTGGTTSTEKRNAEMVANLLN